MRSQYWVLVDGNLRFPVLRGLGSSSVSVLRSEHPIQTHSSLRASVVWRLVVLCVRAHRSRLKSCLGGGDVLHRTAIRPSVAIVTLTISTAKGRIEPNCRPNFRSLVRQFILLSGVVLDASTSRRTVSSVSISLVFLSDRNRRILGKRRA